MQRFNTSLNRLFLLLLLCPAFCFACRGTTPVMGAAQVAGRCTEPNTAVRDYFDVIRSAKPELAEALRKFPKGADLHNHLSGTVMPEAYIEMGIADGDCYGRDRQVPAMFTITPNTGKPDACDPRDTAISKASPGDRDKLAQSLSMLNFDYTDIQSGHDQFFAAFPRFSVISVSDANRVKMLAKLRQSAYADTVSYVETMMSFQGKRIGELASTFRSKYGDDRNYTDEKNYAEMYQYLLDQGLESVITAARQDISTYVSSVDDTLKCGTPAADPACTVSFAFLSEINRNSAKGDQTPDLAKMFTQTAFSFLLADTELAGTAPRAVGVNLVSGEDLPISMTTFETQMKFIAFFHSKYPKVNIALHAGEITPCFVGAGNTALKRHLTDSLNAGAKRIGHGVSFASLGDSDQHDVANLMKSRNALVEIPLTSNAQILGVTGSRHPFPLYWQYGVPSAFSTDDEGVSHANYTDEWIYAFLHYDLSYDDLVALARYSLQYTFTPGQPLWTNVPAAIMVKECAATVPGTPNPPATCSSFLSNSRKATMQWSYEAALSEYRKRYGQFLKK